MARTTRAERTLERLSLSMPPACAATGTAWIHRYASAVLVPTPGPVQSAVPAADAMAAAGRGWAGELEEEEEEALPTGDGRKARAA